jgi:hypothetical protein
VEPPIYRRCFDNTGSSESVCETFTNLNDPTKGEPMHKIFMAKVPDDTNQGIPSQGDSCAFPFFGNVGVPLMATLYIPELNVGLPVWLDTIPNVPNSLNTSQLRNLCHGHPVDVSSSAKSSPPPSPASGEITVTSNQKSKRNRKRKNRKKKSPTSVSHVGDRSTTSASHVKDQHPASASYAGGTHPPSTSHARGESPFTASHTGNRSVASASHVIDPSLTFASHVGEVQPTTASHVGGINSVQKPRRIGRKLKFPCKICKGDHLTHLCPGIPEVQRLFSLSASSYDSKSFEVSSQSIQPLVEKVVMLMHSSVDPTPLLGGEVPLDLVVSQPIQPLVEKVVMPMQSSVDPTLLLGGEVPLYLVVSQPIQPLVATVVMPMHSSADPTPLFGGEVPLDHVFLQPIQPWVVKVVMPIQSSVDPTPILGSEVPLDHVVSQPIQPWFVKLVMPMQSSDDPTLLLGSDVSTDYVFSIFGLVFSEQGVILLASSKPPPSPRIVSFDWNDLVEPRLPSSTPFQIRVEVNSTNMYRCIVDEGASTSILSSSVWKVVGSPKLVSASHELLAFDRHSSEGGSSSVSYLIRWEYFLCRCYSGASLVRFQYVSQA